MKGSGLESVPAGAAGEFSSPVLICICSINNHLTQHPVESVFLLLIHSAPPIRNETMELLMRKLFSKRNLWE